MSLPSHQAGAAFVHLFNAEAEYFARGVVCAKHDAAHFLRA